MQAPSFVAWVGICGRLLYFIIEPARLLVAKNEMNGTGSSRPTQIVTCFDRATCRLFRQVQRLELIFLLQKEFELWRPDGRRYCDINHGARKR